MQGFDTSASHTAYVDALNALQILRIVRDKHKKNWDTFLKTSTKYLPKKPLAPVISTVFPSNPCLESSLSAISSISDCKKNSAN